MNFSIYKTELFHRLKNIDLGYFDNETVKKDLDAFDVIIKSKDYHLKDDTDFGLFILKYLQSNMVMSALQVFLSDDFDPRDGELVRDHFFSPFFLHDFLAGENNYMDKDDQEILQSAPWAGIFFEYQDAIVHDTNLILENVPDEFREHIEFSLSYFATPIVAFQSVAECKGFSFIKELGSAVMSSGSGSSEIKDANLWIMKFADSIVLSF